MWLDDGNSPWRPLLLGTCFRRATREREQPSRHIPCPRLMWGSVSKTARLAPSYHLRCRLGASMTICIRRQVAFVLMLTALGGVQAVHAQYFGRNKVQYEKFDWRILKSDHFDLYFYPSESLKVSDAGREAERWYSRLSDIFRHQFDRKSVVFYADHPDFEQTNVVGEQPEEGTGGITEG